MDQLTDEYYFRVDPATQNVAGASADAEGPLRQGQVGELRRRPGGRRSASRNWISWKAGRRSRQ